MIRSPYPQQSPARSAFTLFEVLVALGVEHTVDCGGLCGGSNCIGGSAPPAKTRWNRRKSHGP